MQERVSAKDVQQRESFSSPYQVNRLVQRCAGGGREIGGAQNPVEPAEALNPAIRRKCAHHERRARSALHDPRGD